MKSRMADKLSMVGAGVGLTLFAVFGLIPGSFIGGMVGLNLAGLVTGAPLAPSLPARVVVSLGMLLGVMCAGVLFTAGGTALGWVLGTVADAVRHREKRPVAAGAHKY